MAVVDLEGVYRVVAKGRVYFYAWKGKGAPRLHGEPGSDQFIAELADARAARKLGDPAKIAGLCARWKASDAWTKPPAEGGLADSTKKQWRPWVDEIQRHFGKLSIRQFSRAEVIRPDIRRWHRSFKAKPRAADMGKQVLSALMSFAVDEDLLPANPVFGIKNLYEADRAELIWTDEDIARLQKAKVSREIVWALKLACLTGLRQADVLRLSWSHVGDLSIELPTGKSSVRGKGRRTAVIPLYDELEALLKEIPKRSTRILTNTEGLPWKSGFSSSWNKAMKAIDEQELHYHDSRGTAATKFYLAGFDMREIAEMLAWAEDKVERIIRRYVRKNALLLDRIRRLREARERTLAEQAGKTPGKTAGVETS